MAGLTAAAPGLLPPEPLNSNQDLSRFANGLHPSLNLWLRERARESEGLSARTYVVCPVEQPGRVVGYYAISTAVEERIGLPSAKLRPGLPAQFPLLLIGRLAVDAQWQGRGVGPALLADALRRCLAASEIAGVRGIIVHAIDQAAAGFYQHHGFIPSRLGERILLMPIETVRSLVGP